MASTTTKITRPKKRGTAPKRETTPENRSGAESSHLAKVFSTPQSKGTTSESENKHDGSRLANIRVTEEDLSTTETVALRDILKAFLRRRYELEEDTKVDMQDLAAEERAARKDEIRVKSEPLARDTFASLLETAIEFCNGDDAGSFGLKSQLRTMLGKDHERLRYHPLVNGVNKVLEHFHEVTVGGVPHASSPDDLIYMVQDPAIIKSKPLSAEAGTKATLRKPDAIGTSVSHVASIGGQAKDCNKSLSHWVNDFIADPKRWAEIKPKERTTWADCWTLWELKKQKVLNGVVFPNYHLDMVMDSGPAAEPSSDDDSSGDSDSGGLPSIPGRSDSGAEYVKNGKRLPAISEDSGVARKKPRKSSTGRAATEKAKKTYKLKQLKTAVSVNVQAAYYGIELLRGRWDRTHSIVLVLKDNLLTLKWYDSQGCISTNPIDIVAQLPLVVVMIIIFQRFDHRMRGTACIDLKACLNGVEVPLDVPFDFHSPWQLKGSHTVATSPVARGKGINKPANSPTTHGHYPGQSRLGPTSTMTESLKDTFLKFSWREETRDPEGLVIKTAKERATYYLPLKKCSPEWVTSHLPDVKLYEEYETLSTRHIRACLGLDTVQSRIPTLMLSKKLHALNELEPRDFRKVIWQLIRCHSLLWKIGIAHGDISFSNLMVFISGDGEKLGTVIDFDQAAIMGPGSVSPVKRGFERTGTKHFLAQDLLRHPDGTIPRLYWHDLESFVWCMTWYVEECHDWKDASYDEVSTRRVEWTRENKNKEPGNCVRQGVAELWKPVLSTAFAWSQARFALVDSPKTDRQWLDILIKRFGVDQDVGTGWVKFSIALRQIRGQDKLKVSRVV
ncbi:hypothetical protein BKA70DRAFT_1226901 [Coprinopsis sp. MPI-PUGE-AT-0042]|nr:hypothetical protein BKA70DRAFT_1226901 [Coprinopsis sp. MPI-PUGE-AT-0042]